jgi:predicted RNase H-like HicB family nuclease
LHFRGDSLDEVRQNIREAIALYIEPAEELVPPAGGRVEELTL